MGLDPYGTALLLLWVEYKVCSLGASLGLGVPLLCSPSPIHYCHGPSAAHEEHESSMTAASSSHRCHSSRCWMPGQQHGHGSRAQQQVHSTASPKGGMLLGPAKLKLPLPNWLGHKAARHSAPISLPLLYPGSRA